MRRGRFEGRTISAEDAHAERDFHQLEVAAGREYPEPVFKCQDEECDARVYPNKRENNFVLSHYKGQGIDCEFRSDSSLRFCADLTEERIRLGEIVRGDFFTSGHIVNAYFFMAGESGRWDENYKRKMLPFEDFVRAIRLLDAGGDWYRSGMNKYKAAFYGLTRVRFNTDRGHPVKWCLGHGDDLILRFLNERRVGKAVLLKDGGYKKLPMTKDCFDAKLKYMYGHPYLKDVIALAGQIILDATSEFKVGRSRFERAAEISSNFRMP